ncbi:type II toxin-antitoxin system VapC family toxin [Alteromonas hispanica]|uniref:PIN domain-containing protein n=1 Tax=Alteromonas hispanica TaxID=315421 RepID=A0A6L9MX92_9ALTE|nr:PIN domain-containing protein [Alteromonas hispanica]NDW22899.1 PIN domain-containing protein [Alteromonas hispanica]
MNEYKLLIVDSCVIIEAFDSDSEYHSAAIELIESIKNKAYKMIMPMHGYFEVKCAIQRLTECEGKTISTPYTNAGDLPFHTQPIDEKFILDYSDVNVPYAKAGDYIFLIMAKKLGIPLVTRDRDMIKRSKKCGIDVYKPDQIMSLL